MRKDASAASSSTLIQVIVCYLSFQSFVSFQPQSHETSRAKIQHKVQLVWLTSVHSILPSPPPSVSDYRCSTSPRSKPPISTLSPYYGSIVVALETEGGHASHLLLVPWCMSAAVVVDGSPASGEVWGQSGGCLCGLMMEHAHVVLRMVMVGCGSER